MIEEPYGYYQFARFILTPNFSITKTTRHTYSFLELLGDVGGLTEALAIIFEVLIWSYTGFAKATTLLTTVFMLSPSKPQDGDVLNSLKKKLQGGAQRITPMNYFIYCFVF